MSGTDLIGHPDVCLCLLSQLGYLPGHPPQLLAMHMAVMLCDMHVTIQLLLTKQSVNESLPSSPAFPRFSVCKIEKLGGPEDKAMIAGL